MLPVTQASHRATGQRVPTTRTCAFLLGAATAPDASRQPEVAATSLTCGRIVTAMRSRWRRRKNCMSSQGAQDLCKASSQDVGCGCGRLVVAGPLAVTPASVLGKIIASPSATRCELLRCWRPLRFQLHKSHQRCALASSTRSA